MSLFLEIAEKVLKEAGQPMSPKAIWKYAEDNGFVTDKLQGRTPFQTLKAKVSVHIRRYGDASVFVRTAPGRFYLRSMLEPGRRLYNAIPLQPAGASERVLVFPTTLLEKLGRFQGIQLKCEKTYQRLLRSSECRYLPRLEAESDDHHKQLVTYNLVTSEGKILAFKRGNYTRTDCFLRGSHCLGFGGHVAESDLTFFNEADLGVADSAVRELLEEVNFPQVDRRRLQSGQGLKLVGALNDDSSTVGRRHFAFIFRYDAEPSREWEHTRDRKGEKAVTDLRWIDPSSPQFSVREFEYWSQLCLREFFPSALRVEPSYLIRRKAKFSLPHILCVLGPVASGKTEATAVLRDDYGYTVVNTGRVLSELMEMAPVPETPREEFSKAAESFIAKPGASRVFAEAIWEQVRMLPSAKLLLDGIRNHSTMAEFRRAAGTAKIALLYVHTPPDIAYRFYRRRHSSNTSIEDFLRIRERSVEREVQEMIGEADAVLYNWTGKAEYRTTIHRMMGELAVN